MRKHRFLHVFKVALIGTVVVAAISFTVMNLWNILMPEIFGFRAIGFWQALGLLILSKLLFGGFRHGGRGSSHWRRRMTERWERMTPEEREKFKQGMRRGCGGFRREPEVTGTQSEAQA